ncbi:MAG: prepilin-type N-terminal cleavage/methylation domain-containing protein [bacterium]
MRTQFSRTKHRTLRPAFTLAEMMVVVVISGMMIALAIPRIDTTRYKADAVGQIVRTTLQNASRTAVTRQHDMIVSFDTVGERIRTIYDANNNGSATAGERVTYRGLDNGILFTDPSVNGVSGTSIHSPISGSSIVVVSGMPTLTFHRDGSVSSDAEIYVSIAARGPKMYRAIVLTQATGRVDWYRLNTSTNKWVIAGL